MKYSDLKRDNGGVMNEPSRPKRNASNTNINNIILYLTDLVKLTAQTAMHSDTPC